MKSDDSKLNLKKRKLRDNNNSKNVKRKVGRPKRVLPATGLVSIVKFFRPVQFYWSLITN